MTHVNHVTANAILVRPLPMITQLVLPVRTATQNTLAHLNTVKHHAQLDMVILIHVPHLETLVL